MPTGKRNDPFRGFNFLVEIDGISQASFQECSGLDASTDVVDYREGKDPNHTRKLSGLNKYTPITLRRGITNSDELWKWRQSAIDGTPDRRNGSIVLLDTTGKEQLRWNFTEAWPSKWTGPSFNAATSAVAIEALEIQHEELKKAK
jgi:phage tail-like protein